MKNLILIICIGLALMMTTGCSNVVPAQGEEAVLVKKPMIFGHGGVSETPVTTGREYVAFTTDSVIVNMQPITVNHTVEDLMSSDNVPLDFNISVRLQIKDSVKLVKKFNYLTGESIDKQPWYMNNINSYLLSIVREEAKKHTMTQLAIDGDSINKMELDLKSNLEGYVKSIDMPVGIYEVNIGHVNPPNEIIASRTETVAQQQRIKTEKERAAAEDQRREAEVKRAIADRAYMDNIGLTAEQFVRLEQIKMMTGVCGDKNCTFIMGQNAAPIITTK
jgi:hypothetical protein